MASSADSRVSITSNKAAAQRRKSKNLNKKKKQPRIKIDESFVYMLFQAVDTKGVDRVSSKFFIDLLKYHGLGLDMDPRFAEMYKYLESLNATERDRDLTLEEFDEAISSCSTLVYRFLTASQTVPDFHYITEIIEKVYNEQLKNNAGQNAEYIPQLAQVNPNQFAISVTTVDGQHFSIGDADRQFCIQSCSKPVSYLIACHEFSANYVHQHVGTEPSGHPFNEIVLKKSPTGDIPNRQIPHNPMINAGAIMAVTMVYPDKEPEERLNAVLDVWRNISGCHPADIGYDHETYLSESSTADRNWCLGFMMKEKHAFPDCFTELRANLEVYFQICSILSTNRAMAGMGATLANGGVNPLTGQSIFKPDEVRNVLPIMLSSGMYDYSGQWAFDVGVPAKSGVGGCVFMVVPNIMGISIWSPRLDDCGNSVRGVAVAKALQEYIQFHHFEVFAGLSRPKLNPTKSRDEDRQQALSEVMFATSEGDVASLTAHYNTGVDVFAKDYDLRTPLHIAASDGHAAVIQYFMDILPENNNERNSILNAKDRWGSTPLSDAAIDSECYKLLKDAGAKEGSRPQHFPITSKMANHSDLSCTVIYSAAAGDLYKLVAHVCSGTDITVADYDGRTPLHLAASNGHSDAVRYLVTHTSPEQLDDALSIRDRWGNTALDDAVRGGYKDCEEWLIRRTSQKRDSVNNISDESL